MRARIEITDYANVIAGAVCPRIAGDFCPGLAGNPAGSMECCRQAMCYENSHSNTVRTAWSSISCILFWLP